MNPLKWKRRIAKLYRLQKNNSRKIILIYHAVGCGPWSISATMFKEQIQWLNQHCKIVSLTELLTTPEKSNTIEVALTFDDGYACLYDVVLPILQAENATATVYINTGWMGGCEKTRKFSNPDLGHYPGEKFLTWDEVKILSQNHWEIGSHGVDHIDLTKQDATIIKQELMNSKSHIQNFLQKECVHFAYTWGRHNLFLEKSVHDAGYHYAVAAQHGVFNALDNPFALPRMNVALEYTLTDFENMIKGHWDFLGHIHRLKKKLKMDAVA